MATDQIERPQFYHRQYVGPDDLNTALTYLRDMRRRHNLAHHTWGIVVGLDLMEQPATDGSDSVDIIVQPGLAVDGFGREILVFQPVTLDRQFFADCTGKQHREVWITYDETPIRGPHELPADRCDPADQRGRVRESFRFAVGAQPMPHDPIQVGGRSATVPGELPAGSVPSAPAAPSIPRDKSVPYQEFPDEGTSPRWLVRLGSVNWEAGFVNWDGSKGRFIKAEPVKLREERRYVGAVTAHMAAPAGKLQILDRNAPLPLPTDPKDPHYAGVDVALAGSLSVDRRVGIGTTTPDTRLHVVGGNDASLNNGSGYLVLGALTDKNIVLDDDEIQARKQAAKSDLDLQAEGGDLIVHRNQAGSSFVVKDSGAVGIGTMNPVFKLHALGPSNDHTGVFGSDLSAANPWPNQLALVGSGTNSEARLGFGTTAADGSGHHTAIVKTVVPSNGGGHLIFQIREPGFQNITERMRITNEGNVGIGTTAPPHVLTLGAPEGTRLEIARISSTLPWRTDGTLNPGSFAINQQSRGSSQPGADFALMRDQKKRLSLGDVNTFLSSQDNGELRFYVNLEESGEREVMRITSTGKVGVGATSPRNPLAIRGTGTREELISFEDPSGTTRWHINQNVNGSNRGLNFVETGVADARLFLKAGGNVGIGTTIPTAKLHVVGNFRATGSKSFVIDHPLDPVGKQLIHATLEGPEVAVFYRGEGQLTNGEAVVKLPGYFEPLTRLENRTVLLTPKLDGENAVSMLAASEVQKNMFTVRAIDDKNPSQRFYWEVKAVRADIQALEPEESKGSPEMVTGNAAKVG